MIRFAYRRDVTRQLTGPELSALAEKFVEATDPVEVAMIRDALVRGFYGAQNNA